MAVQKLFDLKPGDRFYFVGDPKKVVREIKKLVYKRTLSSNPQYVVYSDDKEGHSNREVVFLRNARDEPK